MSWIDGDEYDALWEKARQVDTLRSALKQCREALELERACICIAGDAPCGYCAALARCREALGE